MKNKNTKRTKDGKKLVEGSITLAAIDYLFLGMLFDLYGELLKSEASDVTLMVLAEEIGESVRWATDYKLAVLRHDGYVPKKLEKQSKERLLQAINHFKWF